MKFYMLQIDRHDADDSSVTEIHADNAEHAWERFAAEYLADETSLALADKVAALRAADDVQFVLVETITVIR